MQCRVFSFLCSDTPNRLRRQWNVSQYRAVCSMSLSLACFAPKDFEEKKSALNLVESVIIKGIVKVYHKRSNLVTSLPSHNNLHIKIYVQLTSAKPAKGCTHGTLFRIAGLGTVTISQTLGLRRITITLNHSTSASKLTYQPVLLLELSHASHRACVLPSRPFDESCF